VGEYPLGLSGFHGSEYAAVGGLKSHSCGTPKPITPAKPEGHRFKALRTLIGFKNIKQK